jgi:hypothetical protein
MKTARFLLSVLFLLGICVVLLPKNAFASISGCSADVDNGSVNINSTGNTFNFTVTNNDNDNRGSWVSISAPSGMTIQGDSTFTQYDMGAGTPVNISISADTGGSAGSGSWTVRMSDDSGATTTNCNGNLGLTIVDPSASQAPQVTGVTISNVSDTNATLSWTTNQDSTGELDYGLDGSYGSTQTDSNSSSSHSISISGLSANATYHYDIKATNGNGTSDLGDHTFTTAATPGVVVQTQTVTVTNTSTTVKYVGPTPTPTPVPDRTPPIIYIDNDFSKPFLVSPKITGTATDNKAVAKVEYSLDGGQNWLPMDESSASGLRSMTFSFLPISLDDGNYALQVRGVDTSGNIGVSKVQTMVIDRLPPQVSGVLFSIGPQIVNPNSDGSVMVLADQKFKVNLSEVGGTTSISLLASGSGQTKTFPLIKNSDNGLWSAIISLGKGNYQLSFDAVDGAGNETRRNLNKIVAIDKGSIAAGGRGISGANITVYFQEPVTNQWQVWDGSAYSQSNPQKTDKNGGYNLFLPPGKYYLHIEAYGSKILDTQFFTLNQAKSINADFKLSPLKLLFSLGFIKIYLPDFSTLTVPFSNNLPSSNGVNSLIGKQMPFFNLSVYGQNSLSSDSLTGKPSVLTFLNTWSPSSTEQVSILNNFAKNKDFNSFVIIEGEKLSKTTVFQKRGGYSLVINADPDATLAIPYSINSLPVHYFLNRKGVIQNVIYGSLSEEELANALINITQ